MNPAAPVTSVVLGCMWVYVRSPRSTDRAGRSLTGRLQATQELLDVDRLLEQQARAELLDLGEALLVADAGRDEHGDGGVAVAQVPQERGAGAGGRRAAPHDAAGRQ